MNMNVSPGELALRRSLPDVVAEYDLKRAALPEAAKAFAAAGDELRMAFTIGGTFGDVSIDTGRIYESTLEIGLLKSAWKHVYSGLNIDRVSSADDKQRWRMTLEKPPAFTLENIRETFGKYLLDPRGNILRGLAEVFCSLDPAFKSHDKVKIGVKGLPKRIIVGYVDSYGSYGKDKIESVINALAALQGKPLVTWREISALLNDEDALLVDREVPGDRSWTEPTKFVGRGIRLRRYANKNGHMFFEPDTLHDVNRALAEFYGDVLPDTTEEKPDTVRPGTEVAKDLQYYPTPTRVVDDMLREIEHRMKGARVLEPNAGCGRIMEAARKRGAEVFGIEIDPGRVALARAKGFVVMHANFLETVPVPAYDFVLMNPPFYGKHYAKHVRHAMAFLKAGGTLKAILPITARDHGLLDDLMPPPRSYDRADRQWHDLPVGSFSESGTNINTTILTLHKAGAA